MGAPDTFITRRPSLPSTPSSARAPCPWPVAEAEGAAFFVKDPEAQAEQGLECSAAPSSRWQQARRNAAMACAALALTATALLAVHIALNQGPHTVLHQALRSALHRNAGAATEAPAAAIGSAAVGVVTGSLTRQQPGQEAAASQDSAQPARTIGGGGWSAAEGLHFGAGQAEDLAFEETTAHPSHEDADNDDVDDSEHNSDGSSTSPGDGDEGLLWSEVTGTEAGSLAAQPPLDGLMWSGSDVLSPGQEDNRLSDFDRTFELKLPSNSFAGNVLAQYFVYDVSVVADDPRVAPYLGQVALGLGDDMRFSAYSQVAVHLELDTTALPASAAKAGMYLDASSMGAPSKLPANSVACLMYGRMGLPGSHGKDGGAEAPSKAGEDAASLPGSATSLASRGGLARGQCAEVSAAGADFSDDMATVVTAEVPPSAFVRLEDSSGRVRLVLDMLIAVLTTTATDGATEAFPSDGSALNS